MPEWVFGLPLWVSGPALVVLTVGFSLAGLHTVRRLVLPRMRITVEDSEFTGTMVQSVLVFYGLAVALIAVNVFETYSTTATIVSSEATALAALYRDVTTYPEPARSELQAVLRDYVEDLIHNAWPLQRAGRVPTAGVHKMDAFQARLAQFEPATDGQKIIHAESWRAYNRLIDARRTRLDQVRNGLPGVMWMVVLVGAAIGVSGSYFFHVEDARLHSILVTLLATFIAIVIFVVLAMDRPFRGDLGIPADSYQLIYDQLMKR